jgi:hypothetical protein
MTVPYTGEEFIYFNPDGTKIRVRGWGDQCNLLFETLDGFTVIKDPKSGYLHYAVLSPDQNILLPSGLRVGEIPAHSLPFPTHLRVICHEILLPIASHEEDNPLSPFATDAG